MAPLGGTYRPGLCRPPARAQLGGGLAPLSSKRARRSRSDIGDRACRQRTKLWSVATPKLRGGQSMLEECAPKGGP